MIKYLMAVILYFLIAVSTLSAFLLEDNNIPDTFSMGKGELILNGAGFRKKMDIKVYACGLYLMQKGKDGIKIQDANEPMAIRIIMLRSVGYDDWRRGWEHSLSKSGMNISFMGDRIKQFISCFKDGSKDKDIFSFIYIPEDGVSIYKNDKHIVKIKGIDFKKALFAIYLGENSQKDLKTKLLGQ